MKKFICWLFNIKPEIRYIEKEVVKEKEVIKEKELPKGSILIEAEHIKIGDIEMGIE